MIQELHYSDFPEELRRQRSVKGIQTHGEWQNEQWPPSLAGTVINRWLGSWAATVNSLGYQSVYTSETGLHGAETRALDNSGTTVTDCMSDELTSR